MLLQHKEEIKVYQDGGTVEQILKFRKTEGLPVDHVVFISFSKIRSMHLPYGPTIQPKALKMAQSLLGLIDFKRSTS